MTAKQISDAYPEAAEISPTKSTRSDLRHNMVVRNRHIGGTPLITSLGAFGGGLQYIEISGDFRDETARNMFLRHITTLYGRGVVDRSEQMDTITWDPVNKIENTIVHYESWINNEGVSFDLRIMESSTVIHIQQ